MRDFLISEVTLDSMGSGLMWISVLLEFTLTLVRVVSMPVLTLVPLDSREELGSEGSETMPLLLPSLPQQQRQQPQDSLPILTVMGHQQRHQAAPVSICRQGQVPWRHVATERCQCRSRTAARFQ